MRQYLAAGSNGLMENHHLLTLEESTARVSEAIQGLNLNVGALSP